MPTVFFGQFGGKDHPHSNFSSEEQELLKQSVADATATLSQALVVANKNFKGYHDNIKLWFGKIDSVMFVNLKKSVYRMHSSMRDPATFIKFIDAREQYFHPYIGRLPLDNVPDAHFDELMMKGGPRTKIPVWSNAFNYHLSWPDPNDKYSGHVGSVMNIY